MSGASSSSMISPVSSALPGGGEQVTCAGSLCEAAASGESGSGSAQRQRSRSSAQSSAVASACASSCCRAPTNAASLVARSSLHFGAHVEIQFETRPQRQDYWGTRNSYFEGDMLCVPDRTQECGQCLRRSKSFLFNAREDPPAKLNEALLLRRFTAHTCGDRKQVGDILNNYRRVVLVAQETKQQHSFHLK